MHLRWIMFACGKNRGSEGLPKGDFPDNYDRSRIGSTFGYVRRGGQHGLSGYDWLWLLDFADKAFSEE